MPRSQTGSRGGHLTPVALEIEFGFVAQVGFEEGLRRTIERYEDTRAR